MNLDSVLQSRGCESFESQIPIVDINTPCNLSALLKTKNGIC